MQRMCVLTFVIALVSNAVLKNAWKFEPINNRYPIYDKSNHI